MDVQPYLIKYFEEITEHADESGYMFKRLKGAPTSTALDEVSMFHELERAHFLLGSKELDEIKRAPVPTEEDGMLFFPVGEKQSVFVPHRFIVLSRGTHFRSEVVSELCVWIASVAIAAIIAAFATSAATVVLAAISERPDAVVHVSNGELGRHTGELVSEYIHGLFDGIRLN